MKKTAKHFIAAITVILITANLFSCASGVKLGNTGCKITANYTAVNDHAYGCIVCDSVRKNALNTFKKIFPKSKLNTFVY